MSSWSLIAQVALPVALVLVVLLTCPAPRRFRRGILRLVKSTLGLSFISTFKLLHVMLFITGTAFMATSRATYIMYATKGHRDPNLTPNQLMSNRGQQWRNERNFWISFFSFTLWCLVARLYDIMNRLAQCEDRVRELEAPPLSDGPPAKKAALPSAPPMPAGAQPAEAMPAEAKKSR